MMTITEQLKKGKFWTSGNAHNRARGFKGGTMEQGRALFVKRLTAVLGKFKVELSKVRPAILGVDVKSLAPTTRRQLAAVVKRELQPTVLKLLLGKDPVLYAWWD